MDYFSEKLTGSRSGNGGRAWSISVRLQDNGSVKYTFIIGSAIEAHVKNVCHNPWVVNKEEFIIGLWFIKS